MFSQTPHIKPNLKDTKAILDYTTNFHSTAHMEEFFYNFQDKNWIPHIGINNPSNCKADTKNKGYQEIMFFEWKLQRKKVQLT